MANITNVNELWGRKWRFKDDTSSPSEFSLKNSVTGVKFATFYLGEEVKDVYQTGSNVGNVGITTQGTFIRIGVSESSFTYAYAASGWVGKPAILEFIENTNNYTLSCTNEENFITWFNENASEYVPPLNEWTKEVADAIREKKGTSDLIKPLNFAKEILNLGGGSEGDTLKALLDFTKSCYTMFSYNNNITDLGNLIPFSATHNVTTTFGMFMNCENLITAPLFDTSNVTSMKRMFYYCKKLNNVPLYNTSKVTNMSEMFYYCYNLTTIPQLNTSNVTNMSNMFNNCNKLTTIPQLDTSKVTDMSYMFRDCYNLTTIPQLNTSNVTNMNTMFNNCNKLTTIPQLDTSKVTDMSSMFYDCRKLIEIPQLDTSKVTNMGSMFYNCYALTTIPQLDLAKETSQMTSSFSNCRKLTNLSLLNINVNLVVGSGTSYGHLLTVDSLIGLCKECIKQSATRKLTVGTANLEKLANVYVKFTDPTQTEIVVGEKGDVVVCESTDEGAMLINDYMTLKSWTLA